ncbi:DUF6343 family protein [Ornithinicoccus halotolerans]|uniref:DUF6343 family protein n=1 Tax=Ornithinicoccus halotolerans TaxID=1748220 RepID=UPI001297FD8D|nr:DUF6343 family protein [Ornithinicoccus halotolerans]
MNDPGSDPVRRARPDHHDPTGGLGGAAPAASALTLRLVLATFGLLVCAGGALWSLAVDGPVWITVGLAVLAVVAVVDLVVVARRKSRGEPG